MHFIHCNAKILYFILHTAFSIFISIYVSLLFLYFDVCLLELISYFQLKCINICISCLTYLNISIYFYYMLLLYILYYVVMFISVVLRINAFPLLLCIIFYFGHSTKSKVEAIFVLYAYTLRKNKNYRNGKRMREILLTVSYIDLCCDSFFIRFFFVSFSFHLEKSFDNMWMMYIDEETTEN